MQPAHGTLSLLVFKKQAASWTERKFVFIPSQYNHSNNLCARVAIIFPTVVAGSIHLFLKLLKLSKANFFFVLIIFHQRTHYNKGYQAQTQSSKVFLCSVSLPDPRGRLLSGSAVRDGAGGGQRTHPPRHGLLLGPPLPLRHVRDPGQTRADITHGRLIAHSSRCHNHRHLSLCCVTG